MLGAPAAGLGASGRDRSRLREPTTQRMLPRARREPVSMRRMPRYFFDENGTRDEDGLELDGRKEARAEAVRALPDTARDVLPDGEELTMTVGVRELEGPVFFRATLTFKCDWLS